MKALKRERRRELAETAVVIFAALVWLPVVGVVEGWRRVRG